MVVVVNKYLFFLTGMAIITKLLLFSRCTHVPGSPRISQNAIEYVTHLEHSLLSGFCAEYTLSLEETFELLFCVSVNLMFRSVYLTASSFYHVMLC